MEEAEGKRRRTFGEGVEVFLDIYKTTKGVTLFDEKNTRHFVIDEWKELNKAEPAVAHLIAERLFMGGSIARVIDDLLASINSKVEFIVKKFIIKVLEFTIKTIKDPYVWDKIQEPRLTTPSLLEFYMFFYIGDDILFQSTEISTYKLVHIIEKFENNQDSFEFIDLLTYLISDFYDRFRLNNEKISDLYIQVLCEIFDNNKDSRYSFLIEKAALAIITAYYHSEKIHDTDDEARFKIAFNVLDKKSPRELFNLGNIERKKESPGVEYILILFNWVLPDTANDAQYTLLVEKVLAHPGLDIQQFYRKMASPVGGESNNFMKEYFSKYGTDWRTLWNVYLDILWKMLRHVELKCSDNNDLLDKLYAKIHEIMQLIDGGLISDGERISNYKNGNKDSKITKSILKILVLLQVDVAQEGVVVSHYTSAESAYAMLCGSEPSYFRLMSTLKLNDAYEGRVLPVYLGVEQEKWSQISSHKLGFVGCFTLRRNDYNQFRLYGKSNNGSTEAGGVALEMNKQFFSDRSSLASNEADIDSLMDNQKKAKVLYRCIYMNRSMPTKITAIAGKSSDSQLISRIEELLAQVKEQINDVEAIDGLDNVTRNLIIQLAYLLKNDDYKDEDECRIMMAISSVLPSNMRENIIKGTVESTVNPRANPLIKGIEGSGNLYVNDNREMRGYIDAIVLGDNFRDQELFIHKLRLRLATYLHNQINRDNYRVIKIKNRQDDTLVSLDLRKEFY